MTQSQFHHNHHPLLRPMNILSKGKPHTVRKQGLPKKAKPNQNLSQLNSSQTSSHSIPFSPPFSFHFLSPSSHQQHHQVGEPKPPTTPPPPPMATRCATSVPRPPAAPWATRSNPTLSPLINLHFIPNAASLGTVKAKAKVKGASHGGVSSMAAVPNNSNYVVPLDQNASCITRPLAEILRDLNKRIPENIVNQESKIISWYHANRMLSFYAPGEIPGSDPYDRSMNSLFELGFSRWLIDSVKMCWDREAIFGVWLVECCLVLFEMAVAIGLIIETFGVEGMYVADVNGWCGEVRDVIFSEDGNVTVVYRVTVRGSDGEAYRESTGTASGKHHEVADAVAAAEEAAFVKACSRFGLGLYLYHEE
ncbi:DNA repair RAD52-like protein [Drosera capensis]